MSKALKKQENQAEKVRNLAILMLENPKLSREEWAVMSGVPYQSLCKLIRNSDLLSAIRSHASKKIMALIPLAVQGMEDSITSSNGKIKFMASQEILRSEKILGPERVDVTISDNSQKTVEELQEMIRDAQKVPAPTIDAEVIS